MGMGMYVAYVFALLTGIVSAGFVSSIWPLVTGRAIGFGSLLEPDVLLPLKVIAVVLSGPVLLLREGAGRVLTHGQLRLGLWALAGSLCWSFFQGVIVLTVMYSLAQV